MSTSLKSNFTVAISNDDFIVIIDHDEGASVTNDASNVIRWLDTNLEAGLQGRQVYYRDTNGAYHELVYENGIFKSFNACPSHMMEALAALVDKEFPEGI